MRVTWRRGLTDLTVPPPRPLPGPVPLPAWSAWSSFSGEMSVGGGVQGRGWGLGVSRSSRCNVCVLLTSRAVSSAVVMGGSQGGRWGSLRRGVPVDLDAVLLQLSSEQRVVVLQLLDLEAGRGVVRRVLAKLM